MFGSTPPKAQALFGVALFMLGASVGTSSFVGAIAAFSMAPAMFVFEATSITDIVVSIVAIVASKKYGPKSLISSSVLSGLNTVLRAVALTMVIFFLFSGNKASIIGRASMPNEDETRTQYNLPGSGFPDGQDPRQGDEQEPGRGSELDRPRDEHDGPRRGREEHDQDESDPRDQHEGPRRGREEEIYRETAAQNGRAQQGRARPSPSYVELITPYFALALASWALCLNIAIFVLSILHTRRVMTRSKSPMTATTTVNGKVYSELASKV